MAIGGSAEGAVIVTSDHAVVGDRNIVITGSDADAIRKLVGNRPRNETLLLQAVKKEVTARLKQSLHNAVLIQLRMEVQPEQVKRPWSSDIKIGDKASEPIPDETSIVEIFDQEEIAGKLLILGNPGAGKTTTMLDLANALIARAEQDADYPIPILLNLSAWKDDKQTLQDWLIAELKSKYGVRKDVSATWIEDAKLLPMLDGLDELEPLRQEPCVQKINDFLQSECKLERSKIIQKFATRESPLVGTWHCHVPTTIIPQISSAQIPNFFEEIRDL